MALKIFEKFDPRANPIDGDYPTGSIKNETVPGANDGTPLDADWGNDYVGFDAALFGAANITPSGDPDNVNNSDRLTALSIIINNKLSVLNYSDLRSKLASSSVIYNNIKTMGVIDPRTGGNFRIVIAAGGEYTDNGEFYGTVITANGGTSTPGMLVAIRVYPLRIVPIEWAEGITGNISGESNLINQFITQLSTTKDMGYIGGQYWYELDIEVPSNVVMFGNGKTFTSSLIPLNGAVLRLGTALTLSQHIEIRDITITCDSTTNDATIIKFENCYSVRLRGLRLFNVKGTQRAVDFEGGGDCGLHNVTSRPVSGGGGTNVVYVNSANTVDGVDHTLAIDNCDLEGGQDTIKVVSGHADISGIYSERSSRSILSITGGAATLRGGQLTNSGGSALPVIIEGGSLVAYGSSYYDGDGNEPFVYYLNSGDFSKSSFYGVPNNQIFINNTGEGLPSVYANGQDNSTFSELFTVVDMVDEQVITTCLFTTLSAETKQVVMGYELEAVVTSRGFGKAHRVIRGMISKLSTGEYEFSTPTDVVNTSEDSSAGNSTVQLTPTVSGGGTGSINLELLLTGVLNQTNTEQVWIRFKLMGRTDGVNVDFYGNRNQPS